MSPEDSIEKYNVQVKIEKVHEGLYSVTIQPAGGRIYRSTWHGNIVSIDHGVIAELAIEYRFIREW